MHAEIVMIGSELLLGELVDTNANRLAVALRNIGLDLYYKTTVGDNEGRITDVLNLALDRSDVVITSGGIGPTVDDVTRQAAANATGRRLVYSRELEAEIAERFRSFGRKMAENNRRQAYLPEGAAALTNPVGTAPCFLSEDVNGRGCIISLPGVPRELQHMLDNTVVPLLVERIGDIKVTRVRVLRTCAVGESNIDRGIGDLMIGGNPTVGLAAHSGQTDVRITAKADSEDEADALIDEMETELRKRLGIAIYGAGKETVAEVVGSLLADRSLKLGIADTLTGGQIARDLTEAGYGDLITTDSWSRDVNDVLRTAGLTATPSKTDKQSLADSLAKSVCPSNADGIGLAMLGPFEDNSTCVCLHGPGDMRLFKSGRHYQATDHVHRWLVIQGLDWIRRAVLGTLESPVDWN